MKRKKDLTGQDIIKVGPFYKYIFLSISTITFICFLGIVSIAFLGIFKPQFSEINMIESFYNFMKEAFFMGFGALIGMLIGKTAK